MTPPESSCWFCLRSQPKHEHLVAAYLRQFNEITVFLPRVRFKRATRRGAAWATEALFPGYFFARFNWRTSLRLVQHAHGVRGVVHFGERWPTIPETIIAELRQSVGENELRTISAVFTPGDAVQIAEGTLCGLRAVVSHVMPGRERVAVLMGFLGRQTMIEVPAGILVKEGEGRAEIL
jgi:transcriptional antiterminator RfaH